MAVTNARTATCATCRRPVRPGEGVSVLHTRRRVHWRHAAGCAPVPPAIDQRKEARSASA